MTVVVHDPNGPAPRLGPFDVGVVHPIVFDWTDRLAKLGTALVVESSSWSTPGTPAGVVIIGDGATVHNTVTLADARIIPAANLKTECTLGFTRPGEVRLRNRILFDTLRQQLSLIAIVQVIRA